MQTAKQPVIWTAYFDAENSCELRFMGLSKEYSGCFFDRYPIPLHKGRNKIVFHLPFSPNRLMVLGERISGDGKVSFVKGKLSKLPRIKMIPAEKEFLSLAKKIALHIPAINNGVIKSPKGKFKCRIFSQIKEDGEYLTTPARVEINTGYMQVSRKHLSRYTIPMRMFIMCHEFAHYLNNSLDEHKADEVGADLYLKMGFPKSEAYYALTDILPDDNREAQSRMNNLGNYLDG